MLGNNNESVTLPLVSSNKGKEMPFNRRECTSLCKSASKEVDSVKHVSTAVSSTDSRSKYIFKVDEFIRNVKTPVFSLSEKTCHEESAIQKERATAKKERLQKIETFLSQNCSQHVPEPQRTTNLKKATDDLILLYPSLSHIFFTIWRYFRDISATVENLKETHKTDIKYIEKNVYKKYETFFEEKTLEILREKRRIEAVVKQLREEVLRLKKERDEELTSAKESVMVRLNDCERKEDEFRSFRKLIASVFKTNEVLVNRIEDLELLLRNHRIDIPRANADLYAYNKPKAEESSKQREDDEIRKIYDQVPVDFIEASRQEMTLARLSLQRELLNSAFDDRTAYRLQVNGLRSENSAIQLQVETLKNRVAELEMYIYEKRFISPGTTDDDNVPLTPRPRDVPFTIQTDLGIDLKNSTSQVLAELGAVGINLKHQLNSAIMCLRQLSSVVQWIEEDTILKISNDRNCQGVLPTFSTSAWDNIPHFLRTHVEPNVPNLYWTEADTAAILCDFFSDYESLRASCRYVRDSKMLTPRIYQLFERSLHPLVRLDATQMEVNESEENVPFGYVVSHYISQNLISATSKSHVSKLLQPGTLNPNFIHQGKVDVVGLEFANCSYNLWYWSQQYRESQPLCRLFMDVVDGRLSVKIFDLMESVIKFVDTRIRKFDTDGSNSFTYNKLVSCLLKMVGDMDVQVGRGVALAVTETFQDNQVPLVSGRISTSAVLANEHCVDKEIIPKFLHSISKASLRKKNNSPGDRPLRGASVLTRFWRRLLIQRHEKIFGMLERILGPLVVESEVVVGLFFLPILKADLVLRNFEDNSFSNSKEFMLENYPSLPEKDPLAHGEREATWAAADAPRFTGKYAKMIAERKVSLRGFNDVSLIRLFYEVLESLPRLSRSVHFPLHQEEIRTTTQQTSEMGKSETSISRTVQDERDLGPIEENVGKQGGKKARKGGKKGLKTPKTREEKNIDVPEAIPSSIVFNTDKELVEWYGFCFTMRQQILPLTEKLFVEAAQISHWTQQPAIRTHQVDELSAAS